MEEEGQPDKLEELLANADLTEQTELGEVTKEFSENKPSSSNLSRDEHTLVWRGKSILREISPKSVIIIDDFIDGRRSVGGWNTNKKVEAITGVQNQRQGNFLTNMFKPREGGGQ